MTPQNPGRRPLGHWDAVGILVGIVVGVGIFETPPEVFKALPGPSAVLGLWMLGGVLNLVGALCYGELAATYPRSGGEYVYLSRAFGPGVGFLFGWSQMTAILPGIAGSMAYVFADYGGRFFGASPEWHAAWGWSLAAGAVAVLAGLNLLGITVGKGTQNVLAAVKVIGLSAVLAVGLFCTGAADTMPAEPTQLKADGVAMALVFVLITYGGWSDATFVAAEVRDTSRTLPRALLIGTGVVLLLYVGANAAYARALGFDGARRSRAIAADLLAGPLGAWGERAMCLLVMVSALGGINGLLLAGSRVYASLGADHALFRGLGRWREREEVPYSALVTEAAVCLALIAAVGTEVGREAVGAALGGLGVGAPEWEGHGGFQTLVKCTAPVFWLFFLLTSVALFVLRRKDRDAARPFCVPFYPWIPLVFVLTCVLLVAASIRFAKELGLVGGVLVLAGLPLYALSRRQARVVATPAGGVVDRSSKYQGGL